MTPKVSSRSARHNRPTTTIAALRIAMMILTFRVIHREPWHRALWPGAVPGHSDGYPDCSAAGHGPVAGAADNFAVTVDDAVRLPDVVVGAVAAVAVLGNVLARAEAAGTGGEFRRDQVEHPVGDLLDHCHVFSRPFVLWLARLARLDLARMACAANIAVALL